MTYELAIEMFGITAVIIMVTSYALENISPVFIAIFSIGCALAATYAFLLGSIPFVIAEGIWADIRRIGSMDDYKVNVSFKSRRYV